MNRAAAALGLLLASVAVAAPPVPADYAAEIAAFHKEREARLLKSEPWLRLVGLSWLAEGPNGIGSGPKSRVRLPKGKAPETLGVLTLEKGTVTFSAAPGAVVTSDGKPVTTTAMKPDVSGAPTVLAHGTLTFFVLKRGARLGVRVLDSEAPALRAFGGIPSFPPDPSWLFTAAFEKYEPPKKVEVPNVLGTPETQDSPGAVVFTVAGKKHRLDALVGGRAGELFLVFADRTNGKETYGGGRFLHTPPPAKDGTVVVDFNRALNPPCAFSPYATCPLPPKQNRLDLRVTAGEKTYGKH